MFGIEGISKLKRPDIRILIAEDFGGLRGMREFLPGSGMAHLLTVRDDIRVLGRGSATQKACGSLIEDWRGRGVLFWNEHVWGVSACLYWLEVACILQGDNR